MTILLAATAVANVLTYYQAHLDAKVTALASVFPAEPASGQTVTLAPVAQWHTSEQLPGSYVAPTALVLADDTGGVAEDPTFFESLSALTVGVVDSDATPDLLRWRLYYWMTAAFDVARDIQYQGWGTAGVGSLNWRQPPVVYSSIWTSPSRDRFWMDARLQIGVFLKESQ